MSDGADTALWPVPPALRSSIPGYEILNELGRGGMGVVYRARAADGSFVALKVLRDVLLAGSAERDRFRIEAAAAARMDHPHIVRLIDSGEAERRPWFAMELIEGGSLEQYLRREALSPALAADLVRTLAGALQHAHDRQIIHRDLKPANILLAASRDAKRSDPHPKVADFGLAKRLGTDSTALTIEGAILGTASYMAPEQAAGNVAAIGPATDLYGLGAILYALLTGRPPFQGDNLAQTLQQVIHDEPILPSRLRPETPAVLEAICLTCLEKEPTHRYPSAQVLAEELGRFLSGTLPAMAPADPLARRKRLAQREGFEIIAPLSEGPLATIYRAFVGPLQQPVALKMYAAGTCTQTEWEARLRQSAGLWATLSNPQLVPPQRVGWWDDGPFVASELVPQGSLADRLATPPPPARSAKAKADRLREAVQLAEQVAEVVCYLHRQGAVHGNLKPSNVLLAADGVPRLVDFRATSLVTLIGDGLRWLPPEVLADPAAEPRPYTDVYGLGTILYALLTGQPPFTAPDSDELRTQVQSTDPLPPAKLNPTVPPAIETVCLTCLRKRPFMRFMRAYDVLSALRRERGKI